MGAAGVFGLWRRGGAGGRAAAREGAATAVWARADVGGWRAGESEYDDDEARPAVTRDGPRADGSVQPVSS
ncbi:MAG TPA: hypothetical protein H9755_07355 [Candidatus Dietzia intestinigallinarum]|nr:hypothetical protein [Candidatus Dietzia intestinigallinarum]